MLFFFFLGGGALLGIGFYSFENESYCLCNVHFIDLYCFGSDTCKIFSCGESFKTVEASETMTPRKTSPKARANVTRLENMDKLQRPVFEQLMIAIMKY